MKLIDKLRHPELGLGLRLGLSGGGRTKIGLSLTNGVLPTGLTLTRASTGTHYNASDLIATAAENVARFDYLLNAEGALLIEPQRTNLFTKSRAFQDVGAWSRSNITPVDNAVTSPDGTTNATTLTFTNTGYASLFRTVTAANSTAHVFSMFAKAGNISVASLELRGASGSVHDYTFTLTGAGTATINPSAVGSPTGGIIALANGWYWCWVIKTTTNTAPIAIIGRGASGANGDTIRIWQADLQAGASLMSSIYTDASQATRSADVAKLHIPIWIDGLRFTFDDDSTQDVSVTPGEYTIPTNLNRPRIKGIFST